MKPYRFNRDPVIWLIFAVAVGVPSAELARLHGAQRSRGPADAPRPGPVSEAPAPAEPGPTPEAAGPEAAPNVPTDSAPALAADSTPTPSIPWQRYTPVDETATPIVAAVRSPNGRAAAVLEESGLVTVWNLELHRKISSFASEVPLPLARTATAPSMALQAFADEPSGSVGPPPRPPILLIGGGDDRIRVWNAATGERLLLTKHHPEGEPVPTAADVTVVDVVWSGPSLVTSVGSDGTLAVLHAPPPGPSALVNRPRCPGGDVKAVDSNADYGTVALACARGVYMLPTTRYTWAVVDSSGAAPQKVRLSPDGRRLASVVDGELRVHSAPVVRQWVSRDGVASLVDVASPPMRLRTIQFPENSPPRLLAFSPDGTLLAASGAERTILVWSMTPGTSPLRLMLPRGPVRALWFAPHGHTVVAAGTGDRFLRAFELPAEW